MKVRSVALGVLVVCVASAVALADFCPVCLKKIPKGQRYCKYHLAQFAAARTLAMQEHDVVKDVVEARQKYEAELKKLEQFYKDMGFADKLRRVETELKDVKTVRMFSYANWEDLLPELVPKRKIPEANALYKDAESLRAAVFGRDRKLREAVAKYREVLQKYPESHLVDDCAYRLGEVFEDRRFREYARAAHMFERCFRWNPKTPLPARYRAAYLYEKKLRKLDKAYDLYRLAAKHGPDMERRMESKMMMETLRRKGHGRSTEPGPAGEKATGG